MSETNNVYICHLILTDMLVLLRFSSFKLFSLLPCSPDRTAVLNILSVVTSYLHYIQQRPFIWVPDAQHVYQEKPTLLSLLVDFLEPPYHFDLLLICSWSNLYEIFTTGRWAYTIINHYHNQISLFCSLEIWWTYCLYIMDNTCTKFEGIFQKSLFSI